MSKTIIGRATCPRCGERMSTGSLMSHKKRCPKNPKKEKELLNPLEQFKNTKSSEDIYIPKELRKLLYVEIENGTPMLKRKKSPIPEKPIPTAEEFLKAHPSGNPVTAMKDFAKLIKNETIRRASNLQELKYFAGESGYIIKKEWASLFTDDEIK